MAPHRLLAETGFLMDRTLSLQGRIQQLWNGGDKAGRGRKQENEIGQRLSLEKEDRCCALGEHHRERCRKPTPQYHKWIKTCGPFMEFSSSKTTFSEWWPWQKRDGSHTGSALIIPLRLFDWVASRRASTGLSWASWCHTISR